MIYYQSPRMKACAHRWSEEHLTLAEFWKTKKGEWLLARGLWSHTDDPRNWIPRLQEFKERYSETQRKDRTTWNKAVSAKVAVHDLARRW
jgi:hypothetical protein